MVPKFRELGYPEIAPVVGDAPRPRWSVMIPTYNCAHLLRETLASVLAEGIGPDEMQIEVIDDCSTKDRPEDVVEELGQGRVTFYRHPKNVGAVANFNACADRARGELVHILHGDDLILPGFYREMDELFQNLPEIGIAYCQCVYINEKGNWTGLAPCFTETSGIATGFLEKMCVSNIAAFPAVVVRREVFERIGGFHPTLVHTADWDMWKRAACVQPMGFVSRALACYRMFDGNDTSRLRLTGEDQRDVARAVDLAAQYLPATLRNTSTADARRHAAFVALHQAKRFASTGRLDAAVAQFREALRLFPRIAYRPRVMSFRINLGIAQMRRRLS